MTPFDPEQATEDIVKFIRGFFELSGGKMAVVGLSGGKDSTIVAALCARALGEERVIGVIMPNGKMKDIEYAKRVASLYCDGGIFQINIANAVNSIMCPLDSSIYLTTDQARTNLPARIRMATLYYVAQNMNHGRVANTCNASENYVGYSTWYGDNAGDFAPLHDFTVQEVKAIGYFLGVPTSLVDKVPDDGLCGQTDEDNLGFSYATLDRYIRTGVCEDWIIKKKIDSLHEKNLFKLLPIPHPSNTQKPKEKTSSDKVAWW